MGRAAIVTLCFSAGAPVVGTSSECKLPVFLTIARIQNQPKANAENICRLSDFQDSLLAYVTEFHNFVDEKVHLAEKNSPL